MVNVGTTAQQLQILSLYVDEIREAVSRGEIIVNENGIFYVN